MTHATMQRWIWNLRALSFQPKILDWCIKWNGPFQFGPTKIFRTSFEGCPLWPDRLSQSVGPKYRRFSPSGMYRSIRHVEFPKLCWIESAPCLWKWNSRGSFFFFDDLLRNVLAQHNCALVIRCKRTCYTGRFLAQQRKRKGYTKGVAQKIDNTYVTRNTEFVTCRRKF